MVVVDEVVRLRVPATFALPDLGQLDRVRAAVPMPATRGTQVVADTEDLALARHGVRLTHAGDAWSLRLPPHPGGAASPTVHRLPTRQATIPAAARAALGRLLAGRELVRVARLVVRREPTVLMGPTEEPLLQVGDEEVSVHTGRRLTGRFREVVLQPGPRPPEGLLDACEDLLRAAGALQREDLPRDVRVLGPTPEGLPDLPDPAKAGDDARGAWSAALVRATARLLHADPHLRLDGTGAVAGPTLPLVDAVLGPALLLDASDDVLAPLHELRDQLALLDRLVARRDAVTAAGDVDAPGLVAAASAAVDTGVRALHRLLDDDAHAAALAGLRALAHDPGLDVDEAAGPALASVAGRVGKRWARLAPALDPGAPAESGELAALAAGAGVAGEKDPERFARHAARSADAAREHARRAGVRSWLAATAEQLTPREAFAAGMLSGRHADAPTTALDDWAEALGKLRRDKDIGWLDPPAADPATDPPVPAADAGGATSPDGTAPAGTDHGAST